MRFRKIIYFFLLGLYFVQVETKAQEITTMQVKDNLYFVGDRTFSAFYITGEEVVVIDPLDSLRASATLSAIRKVTDKPVKKVFYSHDHLDHISGGKIFDHPGVEFIAHQKAQEAITPHPGVVPPTHIWNGAIATYDLGNGQVLELYYFGQNHGAGMTVFRFAEHNAIFIIDLVVPDRVLYTYLPDASPKEWVRTLEEIQALDFEEVYMAHVRLKGDREDVTFMQEYFAALYSAVEQELQSNTAFFDIPQQVKLPQYSHLKNYDEWLHMNVWRILMEKTIGK